MSIPSLALAPRPAIVPVHDVPPAEFAPHFAGRHIFGAGCQVMMENIYALRYQVYCLECGFLDAEDYPERRETDEFDDISAHFGAYNLRSELIGYVRLVPPDHLGKFPFEQHCDKLHDDALLPPPGECAEISRLMVRGDYRRRRGDSLVGINMSDSSPPFGVERRTESPQVVLSLYRQMYQYSIAHGIRYWYAAMERSLARSLSRMNFSFQQIGVETDYYGPVAPYLADLRELERRVAQTRPELLEWLRRPESNQA